MNPLSLLPLSVFCQISWALWTLYLTWSLVQVFTFECFGFCWQLIVDSFSSSPKPWPDHLLLKRLKRLADNLWSKCNTAVKKLNTWRLTNTSSSKHLIFLHNSRHMSVIALRVNTSQGSSNLDEFPENVRTVGWLSQFWQCQDLESATSN